MTMTPDSNPKAAAKAAKAYAKASRPWFKKKRYIALLVIGLFVIIAAASGGGSDDGPKAVDSTASTGAKASDGEKAGTKKSDDGGDKVGEKGNPARIGQTIELSGTRYTVTGAHSAAQVGSEYLPEKADGIFVVVDLTIENKKDETKTFVSEAAKFVASDGTTYDVDSDAAIMASGDSDPLILKEMHPDLPTKGQLIFDVPPAKLAGGVLQVGDLFGSDKAYFRLNLK